MDVSYNEYLAEGIISGIAMFLEMDTFKEYLMNLPLDKLEAWNESISEHLLGISNYNTQVIRRLVEEAKKK